MNHHLFRHTTRQSKREYEDRPNRKRLANSETRAQPGPTAATGVVGGRLNRPAPSSPPPAEHDEWEDPTLLPAA